MNDEHTNPYADAMEGMYFTSLSFHALRWAPELKPDMEKNLNDVQKAGLHHAVEMMERYGGGFASAIAKATYRADLWNRGRLLIAFHEIFGEHARMSMAARANDAE